MSKIIAIDGPSSSGKGTLAKNLAKVLNIINIDTGAMYRCLALATIQNNLTLKDEKKIIQLLDNIKIKLEKDGKVFLNHEDVTDLIRSKEVNEIVSQISSIVEVRNKMVQMQRTLAENQDVVMEGRDITTNVFPSAKYKIYLDASIDKRVERRLIQNKEKNIQMSEKEIYENIKMRDYNDIHKAIGSLKRTNEQTYIDSTNMTEEEVLNKVLEIVGNDN